jgi:hypothetical protein
MRIGRQIIGTVDARARHVRGLAILQDAVLGKASQPHGKFRN